VLKVPLNLKQTKYNYPGFPGNWPLKRVVLCCGV